MFVSFINHTKSAILFCCAGLLVGCDLGTQAGTDQKSQLGGSCEWSQDCEQGLECSDGMCVFNGTGSDSDVSTGGDTYAGATWFDSDSGLTWQKSPAGLMNWADARTYCASWSGGWRVPTVDELRSLIRGCEATEPGGECHVQTDHCVVLSCAGDSCNGCAEHAGPSNGFYWPSELSGPEHWHWSSSKVEGKSELVWVVIFFSANVNVNFKENEGYVRCVRSNGSL